MARIYVRSPYWTVAKFLLLMSLLLFTAGMVGWFVVYFATHLLIPAAVFAVLATAYVLIRRRS